MASKDLERSRSVADTAFSIAVVRAQEAELPPEERLFDDPFASTFAAAGAHAAEGTQRYLELPFFRDGVRLRTRFIDDAVRDGLAGGLRQVVILGAGFDSRGLRMAAIRDAGARVYEVDHEEQLARKRELLTASGVEPPAWIDYIPVDFDAPNMEATLATALEAKGLRRGTGVIYIWEGVIGYIGLDATHRSLRFMADFGGPRSRLVFTYAEGSFDPLTSAESVERAGFGSLEEIAGHELWRRYLPGEAPPTAFVMKLGLAVV